MTSVNKKTYETTHQMLTNIYMHVYNSVRDDLRTPAFPFVYHHSGSDRAFEDAEGFGRRR